MHFKSAVKLKRQSTKILLLSFPLKPISICNCAEMLCLFKSTNISSRPCQALTENAYDIESLLFSLNS